jgi:hypothetical protein
MEKRTECRKCGAKLRHDKTSDQYDPEYCSGKCRKEDGAEPYVKSAEEQAMVVEVTKKARPASLEDYKKNVPSKYARRFEPEKLNWSKNVMNEDELIQAGFRANREPIPGDWDYEDVAKEIKTVLENMPTDMLENIDWNKVGWNMVRARAKELGIKTHGKKRPQIEAEIQEKENG